MQVFLCGAEIWTGAKQVEADSYRPQHNLRDRFDRTGHVYADVDRRIDGSESD
jgi:hypothetical protein